MFQNNIYCVVVNKCMCVCTCACVYAHVRACVFMCCSVASEGTGDGGLAPTTVIW